MEDWPSDLPQFLQRDDFEHAPARNVEETQTDSGAIMRRRTSTSGEASMSGSMKMTTEQFEALLDFYYNDVFECEAFQFPDPDSDGSDKLVVVFAAAPKRGQKKGTMWTVRLEFKVQE